MLQRVIFDYFSHTELVIIYTFLYKLIENSQFILMIFNIFPTKRNVKFNYFNHSMVPFEAKGELPKAEIVAFE